MPRRSRAVPLLLSRQRREFCKGRGARQPAGDGEPAPEAAAFRGAMSEERALTAGLMWHSVNSDNFGIGALTVGNIAIVERIAEELGIAISFRIIGSRDEREPYVTGPNVAMVPVRERWLVVPGGRLDAALAECDAILDIGAGDSFTDIYGTRRFVALALSKLAALRTRRPLVLSPQTIGPFRRAWTRNPARWLMNRARAVVVRDEVSRTVAESLGVTAPIIEATDVAFRLPYRLPERQQSGMLRVGINVSGLLFNGGYTRDNMFDLKLDYPHTVREIIRHFVENERCEVHLISHVMTETLPVEDDYRVCEALAKEIPGCIVAPRFRTPSEAKSYIAGMDFLVGSRMHACIAAFSSGVPVAPLAYSRKFGGLFQSLGYPLVIDCRKESGEQAVEKVMSGFADRKMLARAVEAGNRRADDKLAAYEALLREVLSAAAEAKR